MLSIQAIFEPCLTSIKFCGCVLPNMLWVTVLQSVTPDGFTVLLRSATKGSLAPPPRRFSGCWCSSEVKELTAVKSFQPTEMRGWERHCQSAALVISEKAHVSS